MNATEKLQEVKDEEELNSRGLYKVTCPACKGIGYSGFSFAGLGLMPQCARCKGDGISWEFKVPKKKK